MEFFCVFTIFPVFQFLLYFKICTSPGHSFFIQSLQILEVKALVVALKTVKTYIATAATDFLSRFALFLSGDLCWLLLPGCCIDCFFTSQAAKQK